MSEQQGSIFTVDIPGPEPREVKVRFPSDEQWIDRRRKRKVVLINGQGKPTEYYDVDAELVAAIRADGGQPAIEPGEAEYVLKQIEQADIDEITREGDKYRIALLVPGSRTEHILRVPTIPEINKSRKKTHSSNWVNQIRQEITIDLGPIGELYDKLDPKTEGYAGPVPVIHKSAVIEALIAEVERPAARQRNGNTAGNF